MASCQGWGPPIKRRKKKLTKKQLEKKKKKSIGKTKKPFLLLQKDFFTLINHPMKLDQPTTIRRRASLMDFCCPHTETIKELREDEITGQWYYVDVCGCCWRTISSELTTESKTKIYSSFKRHDKTK